MTKEEIYQKFLERFPQFEANVKVYYSKDENSIKIYTKQNKRFIFEIMGDDFRLYQD